MPLEESQISLINRRLLAHHDKELERLRADYELFKTVVVMSLEQLGIDLDKVVKQAARPKPTPAPAPQSVPVFVDAWTELCRDDSEKDQIAETEIIGSTATGEVNES